MFPYPLLDNSLQPVIASTHVGCSVKFGQQVSGTPHLLTQNLQDNFKQRFSGGTNSIFASKKMFCDTTITCNYSNTNAQLFLMNNIRSRIHYQGPSLAFFNFLGYNIRNLFPNNTDQFFLCLLLKKVILLPSPDGPFSPRHLLCSLSTLRRCS